MPLKMATCLSILLFLTSCARNIILHPLTGSDIYDGKNKGDVCFSQYYLNQVMQVKIDNH